jgi:hypothetical protein
MRVLASVNLAHEYRHHPSATRATADITSECCQAKLPLWGYSAFCLLCQAARLCQSLPFWLAQLTERFRRESDKQNRNALAQIIKI